MKKLISTILTLALIFAVNTTAFASEANKALPAAESVETTEVFFGNTDAVRIGSSEETRSTSLPTSYWSLAQKSYTADLQVVGKHWLYTNYYYHPNGDGKIYVDYSVRADTRTTTFYGIFLGWWNEIPSIFSFGGFNLVPTIIKALSGEIVIGSWVKTMLIGNVAMLLPLGFFLPFVTEKVNKKNIYAVAVVVPSIAELLQIIFGRSLDVDDLICNFIGIVAGFFIGLAIRNIKGKNKTINDMPTTRSLPKVVEKQKEKSS